MDNVIRPTFGRRPEPVAPAALSDEHKLLKLYGTAAGYLVGLIRGQDARLRIVVGPEAGNAVEAVGIVPDTAEGETDAERIGMAVLRTLEIVGDAGHSAQ